MSAEIRKASAIRNVVTITEDEPGGVGSVAEFHLWHNVDGRIGVRAVSKTRLAEQRSRSEMVLLTEEDERVLLEALLERQRQKALRRARMT